MKSLLLLLMSGSLAFGQASIQRNYFTTNAAADAAAGRSLLGINTNLYTLTNDTRGLALSNLFNSFTGLALYLTTNGALTSPPTGRLQWSNGIITSPDDNQLLIFDNTGHGGGANGNEWQVTVNQMYFGPVDGGHIQLGLGSHQNEYFIFQHMLSSAGNNTNGHSATLQFTDWFIPVSSAVGNVWSIESTNYGTNGHSLLNIYGPSGNDMTTGQRGPTMFQFDQSGIFNAYTGFKTSFTNTSLVSQTNGFVNWTNFQKVEYDLNGSLTLIETNLSLTNQSVEQDLFVFGGASGGALTCPTNWIAESESGVGVLATNVPASKILHIHLTVLAGSTTNTFAKFTLASYTPTFDADAQKFFTASGITDATIKGAVNKMVLSLKANSLWSRWDCIYPFVGGTSNTCSWNLANTNNYRIAWSSSGLTFDSTGVLGDGSSGWGNTQFRPSTATSPQWSSNSAAMATYIGTSGLTTGSFVSSFASGTARSALRANASGQVAIDGPNSTSAIPLVVSPDTGTLIGTRTSSTQLNIYMSGTSSGGSAASVGVPNNQFGVLCRYDDSTPDQFCAGKLKILMLGAGVTSGEVTTLTTIINQFQTDLSRL